MNFPQAAAMSTLRFVTTWGYNRDSRAPKLRYGKHFRHLSKRCKSRADRGSPGSSRLSGSGRLSDARAVLKEARGRGYHLRRVFAMV